MPREKRIRRPNDPISSSQPESLELRKRREALENILNNIYQLGTLLLSVVNYDPSIQALIARNASVYIKRCVADEPSPLSPEERSVERIAALNELMDPQTDKAFGEFAAKRHHIYTKFFAQSAETARQRYLSEQENPQHTINAIDTVLRTYFLKTADAT